MIEFKGQLTGKAQKCFFSQIIKLQQTFMIVTLVLSLIILLTICYFYFNVNLFTDLNMYILLVILIAIGYLVPKIVTKKEKERKPPKRVYINDGIIMSVGNSLTESAPIEKVKEVRDFGEYYAFVFIKDRLIARSFICQKDLLTQGSIEEFEALFDGKIQRM